MSCLKIHEESCSYHICLRQGISPAPLPLTRQVNAADYIHFHASPAPPSVYLGAGVVYPTSRIVGGGSDIGIQRAATVSFYDSAVKVRNSSKMVLPNTTFDHAFYLSTFMIGW